jgi:geranylgeranyl diphosphate synthase type I
MVGGKTASLFNACAEIGAIVGGGGENEVKNLGVFAWNAGIAFQIVDDVLGLTSEENVLGKPIGSDLREGKKTLIVIHAYKNASEDEREILEKVLGVNDADAQDIKAAISILSKNGSIDYAKEKAETYVEKALKSLDIFPESKTKTELVELVEYFKRRVF